MTNYYATQNGSGSGTQSSPFSISNFWGVANPGDTLLLLNGTYTGTNNMIACPSSASGTSSQRINIKALNDGQVYINGQTTRTPVHLNGCHYVTVEGINVFNSGGSGCLVNNGASYNEFKRICSWDALINGNSNAFRCNDSEYTLVEDCAGWGTARKTFDASAYGNHVTFRRCWGRWDGSIILGPKMTFTIIYDSYNNLMENCIGAWGGFRMPSSYVLFCNPGSTNVNCGQTITWVDQADGIISMDRLDGSKTANARVFGCISYVLTSDRFSRWMYAPLHAGNMDYLTYDGNVSYIAPNAATSGWNRSAIIFNNGRQTSGAGLIARNNIGIGGLDISVGTLWQSTNNRWFATYPTDGSIFTNNPKIYFRYQDGVLTNTPVWPWPMNQRIIDAMTYGGYAPVNVNATIASIFGPIPNVEPPEPPVADITPPVISIRTPTSGSTVSGNISLTISATD